MTHNCDAYLNQLYTYLDGELTDLECAHLRSHLEACPPCLQEPGWRPPPDHLPIRPEPHSAHDAAGRARSWSGRIPRL